MHIPTDIPLAVWIRELIAAGRLYRFYKTEEWLDLRQSILDYNHNECEWCRDNEGKVSPAVTVHHVMEVKDYPSLALTPYVTDCDGSRKRVLVSLCAKCHNKAHGRFQGPKRKKKEKPLTEERWD